MDERYENTVNKLAYLESRGHKVNSIWECKFKALYYKTKEYLEHNKYVPEFFLHNTLEL
jgi:G:T-mismatch repair DNA endonuclease (very short patch repair protein)